MPLLALLITFVLMWLLLVRPQQRRVREHQAVVSSLRVGDEVVTAGGIYGRITTLDDESVSLEVAPGIVVRALRAAVNQRVEPEVTDVEGFEVETEATGTTTGGPVAAGAPPGTPDDPVSGGPVSGGPVSGGPVSGHDSLPSDLRAPNESMPRGDEV